MKIGKFQASVAYKSVAFKRKSVYSFIEYHSLMKMDNITICFSFSVTRDHYLLTDEYMDSVKDKLLATWKPPVGHGDRTSV